jgi:hypothetical protein
LAEEPAPPKGFFFLNREAARANVLDGERMQAVLVRPPPRSDRDLLGSLQKRLQNATYASYGELWQVRIDLSQIRPPQSAASFISKQVCDVAYWHETAVPIHLRHVCSQGDERTQVGHRGMTVDDPLQTTSVIVSSQNPLGSETTVDQRSTYQG